MSADLLVQSRAALLDALVALAEQRKAVVVIGAQAIYPRTRAAPVALAESTKDCDLALDPRVLSNSPLIDEAMTAAGFVLNPKSNQPGAWQTPTGIPVDLMFPSCWPVREAAEHEALACLRTTRGRCDGRWVSRLNDKDAHDLYRILRGKPTDVLTRGFTVVLEDRVSQEVSHIAVDGLKEHVASGPEAAFAVIAGRTEEGIGEPDTVSLATALLASPPATPGPMQAGGWGGGWVRRGRPRSPVVPLSLWSALPVSSACGWGRCAGGVAESCA